MVNFGLRLFIYGWFIFCLAPTSAFANPDFDRAERLTQIAFCESPDLRIGYSIDDRRTYIRQAIGLYAKALVDEAVKALAEARYEVLNALLPVAASENFWDAGTTCPAFRSRYAQLRGLKFFAGYSDMTHSFERADAFCRFVGHREAEFVSGSADLKGSSNETEIGIVFSRDGRIGMFPFIPDHSKTAVYYTRIKCQD